VYYLPPKNRLFKYKYDEETDDWMKQHDKENA